MAEAFLEGHMERPTDTLLVVDVKMQIEAMLDASYLIEKGQYGPGGKLLLEILKKENSKPPDIHNSFMLEVKFNALLTDLYSARDYPVSMAKLMSNFSTACENLLKQIEKHEEIYMESQDQEEWPFADGLRIRIYTALLQLSVKSGLGNDSEWLDELIDLLKYFQF